MLMKLRRSRRLFYVKDSVALDAFRCRGRDAKEFSMTLLRALTR
jgi:hypothetical protein